MAADALVLKVREGGRVVNVHALVATGVNADGHREILGLQVTSAEDGAGWLAFFRDLTARGLTGVALVTSDAHSGLVEAIGATLPGAGWQRCRTHYAANLMSVDPEERPGRGSRRCCTRSTTSPTPHSVHAQFDRVLDALADKLPAVADHLDAARADVLAFTAFPKEIWRQIWSNNPRSGSTGRSAAAPTSSGIFPDRDALIRLVGAVLAEQHDEWTEGRRYLGLDVLARSRITSPPTPPPTTEEVTPSDLQRSAPNQPKDHASAVKHHATGLDPDFARVSDEQARALFDALRLETTYDSRPTPPGGARPSRPTRCHGQSRRPAAIMQLSGLCPQRDSNQMAAQERGPSLTDGSPSERASSAAPAGMLVLDGRADVGIRCPPLFLSSESH